MAHKTAARPAPARMLFNSFAFLLVFLPAALVLHGAVERFRPEWRLPALAFLSFVF